MSKRKLAHPIRADSPLASGMIDGLRDA